MRVHVSLHDVTPAFEAECRAAVALCATLNVRPTLLVVPDYHACAPLSDAPRFVGWLRELEDRGHELFLHGFHHSVPPTPPSGPRDRAEWIYKQRLVSNLEAEFGCLTEDEAVARLESAEKMLLDVAVEARGFVAPAWSMRSYLPRTLAARGYTYTEDHLYAFDLATGTRRLSPVLNYATRSRWRAWSTIAYCRGGRALGLVTPLRVAIHPADLGHVRVRAELENLLRWAAPHAVSRAIELFSEPL